MAKSYEEYLKELPLFVSFPRTGCNWLQAVMELYFDRHRAGKAQQSPSWIDTPFDDPLWVHSHDNNGNVVITDRPVVYLWRDPVDSIFSLCRLMGGNMSENVIGRYCYEFKNVHYKWTRDENKELRGGGPVLVVRYEDCRANPHEQMERISAFFNVPFDKERSELAFKTVGDKKSTFKKEAGKDIGRASFTFKNPDSHTPQYDLDREEFRKKWGGFIYMHTGVFPTE